MSANKTTVLVTGASGYIGRHLVAHLARQGFRVHALTRHPDASEQHQDVAAFRFRIGEDVDVQAFANVQAVIHAASNTRSEASTTDEMERQAAVDLLNTANHIGVSRFVYLSSVEARATGGSAHARLKWAIEREVLAQDGIVVRAGLVYGGASGYGMFGRLDRIAAKAPCIPMLVPAPRVHPIHIDDFCQVIGKIVGCEDLASGAQDIHEATDAATENRVFTIAQPQSIALGTFLRRLAWHRHRRLPLRLPIPRFAVALVARLAIVLVPKEYAKHIEGLSHVNTQDQSIRTHCEKFGVSPQPLVDGLLPAGRTRRNLLEEGFALIRYVGGRKPRPMTLRRYARSVASATEEETAQGKGVCLALPPIYLAFPPFLRLLDPKSPILLREREQRELTWRLPLAVALAEADPQIAPSFHWRTSAALLSLGSLVLGGFFEIAGMALKWFRRGKSP